MDAGFEQAQALTNLWTQMAVKMMCAGLNVAPDQPPAQAQRQLRDAALSTMAQQTDAYLRSPQFLESMKQSLDASIAFRKQLNEFFTQAQHSVQGVARQDVGNTLAISLRHMERRVLDRIEELSNCVETVSRRLDAIESSRAGGNGHAAPTETVAAASKASRE